METRKIQLAGGTTYTVSLPKEWASEHGIEPGVRVRLYPHTDGSLVVRTNGRVPDDDEPLTVQADDRSPATIRRTVAAAYRTGHDAVVVSGGLTDDQRRAVSDAAQGLLGVDVVEQSDSRVVCRSLLDASDVSLEQTLRQLQFVACASVRDAVVTTLEADADPQTVTDRRAEAARLVALVARQFERTRIDPGELDGLGVSRATVADYYDCARQLQRVTRHAATIAAAARRRDDPVPADHAHALETTADDARSLVERATGALLDDDPSSDACALLARRDEVVATALDRALADDTPGWLAVVYHALASTAECTGAVADVALRAATRQDGNGT